VAIGAARGAEHTGRSTRPRWKSRFPTRIRTGESSKSPGTS
jgi:hypothetical protein